MIQTGKLQLPAVQRWGADHSLDGLYQKLEEVQGLRSTLIVKLCQFGSNHPQDIQNIFVRGQFGAVVHLGSQYRDAT